MPRGPTKQRRKRGPKRTDKVWRLLTRPGRGATLREINRITDPTRRAFFYVQYLAKLHPQTGRPASRIITHIEGQHWELVPHRTAPRHRTR